MFLKGFEGFFALVSAVFCFLIFFFWVKTYLLNGQFDTYLGQWVLEVQNTVFFSKFGQEYILKLSKWKSRESLFTF